MADPATLEMIDVCCACCHMGQCTCDCCCALWCCLPCTYVSAAKQLGATEFGANAAACCYFLHSDPNAAAVSVALAGTAVVAPATVAGPSLGCVFKLCSVFLGQSNRAKFDFSPFQNVLHKSGDNLCCRFCCEPCVLCQEIEAAIQVLRVRDPDANFGSCSKGQCCFLVNGAGNVIRPPSDPRIAPISALPMIGLMPRA